jgi:hypothetical protein
MLRPGTTESQYKSFPTNSIKATQAPRIYWDQYSEGKPIELDPGKLHLQIPESAQIVPVSESKLRVLARAAHEESRHRPDRHL